MKLAAHRLHRLGLAAALLVPATAAAQSGAPNDGLDVYSAACSEATDPLSTAFNYIVGAFSPDRSNPANVARVPLAKVFVPESQRAGLVTKRIVLFGDWFGMPKDTPPYITDGVRKIFAQADLVLGNVEAPITYNNGNLELDSDQTFNFHENVAYLKSSMAQLCLDPAKTVFTVANNHAGDRKGTIGPVLWPETVENVQQKRVGAATFVGMDNDGTTREPQITVKDLGGIKVGIVGWTHLQNNAPAKDASGKIIYPSWEASRRVFEQPKAYWDRKKSELGIKLLIGVPHWDCQWKLFPRTETVAWADELHAKGFDIIAGGHSGLMPAKVFPNTSTPADNDMVFYSLGALNNGLGWINRFFTNAVELVVDSTGRTLEYKVHRFALRKVEASSNWLRGTPLCGTKLYLDWTRPSEWRMELLDELATSTNDADADFYDTTMENLSEVWNTTF